MHYLHHCLAYTMLPLTQCMALRPRQKGLCAADAVMLSVQRGRTSSNCLPSKREELRAKMLALDLLAVVPSTQLSNTPALRPSDAQSPASRDLRSKYSTFCALCSNYSIFCTVCSNHSTFRDR